MLPAPCEQDAMKRRIFKVFSVGKVSVNQWLVTLFSCCRTLSPPKTVLVAIIDGPEPKGLKDGSFVLFCPPDDYAIVTRVLVNDMGA